MLFAIIEEKNSLYITDMDFGYSCKVLVQKNSCWQEDAHPWKEFTGKDFSKFGIFIAETFPGYSWRLAVCHNSELTRGIREIYPDEDVSLFRNIPSGWYELSFLASHSSKEYGDIWRICVKDRKGFYFCVWAPACLAEFFKSAKENGILINGFYKK